MNICNIEGIIVNSTKDVVNSFGGYFVLIRQYIDNVSLCYVTITIGEFKKVSFVR